MSETKIVAIPTHIKPSVDKIGRKRPAHISTRHRAVPVSETPPEATPASPLDEWITKHGGAEHLRKTLEDLTADQRAKLLDAMAHVDGTDPAAVMKKLGIHEPEASEDQKVIDQALEQFRTRLAEAKDAAVITSDEYDLVVGICEKEGLEAALAALAQLRAAPADPPAEPVIETPPEPAVTEHMESVARDNGAAIASTLEQRAALEAQAADIYQKHVEAQNKAHRATFEIEKRGIRGWKVTEAMRDEARSLQDDAARYLAQWTAFVQEHRLGPGLS